MKLVSPRYVLSKLMVWRPCIIRNSIIDKKAAVGGGAQMKDSRIDRYSYMYGSCLIHTKVGKFCSIASKTLIGGGGHPVDWVSSSPVFYQRNNVLKKEFATKPFQEYAETIIGNDVWIGSHCLIKGGVSIGDGAVVGMGSVVTKDIPPYEIWGGNPAKCIRKRFDDETIARLQALQWWNWDDEKLHKYGAYFNNPAELFAKLEEEK